MEKSIQREDKMKITMLQKYKGEIILPWYYGCAYFDYVRAIYIYYPIPLNYIIAIARLIKYRWDMYRSKPIVYYYTIKKIELRKDKKKD